MLTDVGQFACVQSILDFINIPGVHVIGGHGDRVQRTDCVDQRGNRRGGNQQIGNRLLQYDGILGGIGRNAHVFGDDE